MRLLIPERHKHWVIVLPIGIGQLGKDTPINRRPKLNVKAGPTLDAYGKMHAEYRAGEPLPAVAPASSITRWACTRCTRSPVCYSRHQRHPAGIGLRVSHACVRLRNDDIKFCLKMCRSVPAQFIDEPVKATTEPDGSRYIEVHNPLSTTEAQFEGKEAVPITLNKSIPAVTNEPDADQTVATTGSVQDRSGMPVRLN